MAEFAPPPSRNPSERAALPAGDGPKGSVWPVIYGASRSDDLPPAQRQASGPLPAEGLRVKLEPVPGLTPAGLLTRRGLAFQCPPMDEFTVEYAHSHTDYETLQAQHSRKGVPQLATVAFDTLVLDWATFAVSDFGDDVVANTTTKLREIVDSGAPFLLTAAHAIPPRGYAAPGWEPEVQWPATLRSLRIAERAGEGDTRYLNVSFVQYEEPKVFRQGKQVRRGSDMNLPTVVYLYGDGHAETKEGRRIADPPVRPVTFRELARRFYGDPSRARVIATMNGLTDWGNDDALIAHPRFRKLRPRQRATIKIPKPAGWHDPDQTGGTYAPDWLS